MSTDQIVQGILLRAPLARVWHAIADSAAFGHWFGMRFQAPFAPGAVMRGVIVPTTVDAAVAAAQKPYEGTPAELTIVQMESERLFSYRWHPFAIEPGVDYSAEPTTLIAFTLDQTAEGVLLTVTESGFDQLPPARRALAYAANEGGWGMVVKLIEAYVTAPQ